LISFVILTISKEHKSKATQRTGATTGGDEMRFRKAGKVADHLWYLGREEAGAYYLEGRNGAS